MPRADGGSVLACFPSRKTREMIPLFRKTVNSRAGPFR